MKYYCHVEIFDFVDATNIYGRHRVILCIDRLKRYLVSQELKPILVFSRQCININHHISDILAELDPGSRAVTFITAYSARGEIEELHKAGVRGASMAFDKSEVSTMLDRIYAIDQAIPSTWHVESCLRLGAKLFT